MRTLENMPGLNPGVKVHLTTKASAFLTLDASGVGWTDLGDQAIRESALVGSMLHVARRVNFQESVVVWTERVLTGERRRTVEDWQFTAALSPDGPIIDVAKVERS